MAAARDDIPGGLRTARLVLWVQGVIGVFVGISLIAGYQAVTTAYNISGTAAIAAVIAAGVVLAVASALVVWGATLLGSAHRTARTWVLVFEYVSIVLGLVMIIDDLWEATLRIVLAAVVIYYLQLDADTRLAFGLPAKLRRSSHP